MQHDPEKFPLYTEADAPPEAREMLRRSAQNLGSLPNLERVMASAPPLLEGYTMLWELFDKTSLSPIERQVVYQTANYENSCSYCIPWHTWLSKLAKMPEDISDALRRGAPLPDGRLEALRTFARQLIERRGHPTEEEKQAFYDAGWTPQNALEVVLGLSVKLMSNYTNGIAGTPLDKQMQAYK